MRLLYVSPHMDDFEFTAAGTFAVLSARQRERGLPFAARLLVVTDGQAGHHELSREATGRVRWGEQLRSAREAGFPLDVVRLTLPDGSHPRDGCTLLTKDLMAAFWLAAREFGPDYIFCPPVSSDPTSGLHPDHETTGQMVRHTAYMLNVPHAFTPEYPRAPQGRVNVPVILTAYDAYNFSPQSLDIAVDVSAAAGTVARMAFSHQSQVREWLPWVSAPVRMPPPADVAGMLAQLRRQWRGQNTRLRVAEPLRDTPLEFFTVTSWGAVPDPARLRDDFRGAAHPAVTDWGRVTAKVRTWRGKL